LKTALTSSQLATQYYASLCYDLSRHSLASPATNSDPYSIPFNVEIGDEDAGGQVIRPLKPDSPTLFAANQVQLVRDLVIKEQQIEYLIKVLPGIGTSEKEQEDRIRSLEKELRQMQEQRKQKRKEMRAMVKRLENVITGVASSHGQG
jgi:Subunit 21 of Mediator complex